MSQYLSLVGRFYIVFNLHDMSLEILLLKTIFDFGQLFNLCSWIFGCPKTFKTKVHKLKYYFTPAIDFMTKRRKNKRRFVIVVGREPNLHKTDKTQFVTRNLRECY